uniref:Arrestin_N domain-containing protein n=2 Tax=Caenorhabditis tropicalis TaxID=1561998 RepID=A0A1I7TR75_9PELO
MDPMFTIDFEQPTGVYSPGQTVRGTLTIRNESALNALLLKICIHGEVKTFWRKYENKTKYSPHGHHSLKDAFDFSDRHGRLYKASEHINYTSTINILNGVAQPWSSIDNPLNRIPPGVNIFPFVFQLPMNCPPSFEGTHGTVRYSVHVDLNRPWALDMEAKKVFSVIPVVDLNTIPKTMNPIGSHAWTTTREQNEEGGVVN